MGEPVISRLTLANDLTEIARCDSWLEMQAAKAGLDHAVFMNLKLCLNEALANVISYGFTETRDPFLTVYLWASKDLATATITDNGTAFDPTDRPLAQPYHDLQKARIGGFGLKIICETADEVHYEHKEGLNILVISCSG